MKHSTALIKRFSHLFCSGCKRVVVVTEYQKAHLHDALHRELAHARLVTLPQHCYKWSQCVLLVREVLQLSTCQQLGHQLTQRVDRIQRDTPAVNDSNRAQCQAAAVTSRQCFPAEAPGWITVQPITCCSFSSSWYEVVGQQVRHARAALARRKAAHVASSHATLHPALQRAASNMVLGWPFSDRLKGKRGVSRGYMEGMYPANTSHFPFSQPLNPR